MKVVIVAEHASARFGGEAILPLHYFRLLRSRNIEAWLVVHARTRDELEALFPEDHDRLHFVPDTRLHRFLHYCERFLPPRIAGITLGLTSHLYTQYLQRKVVARLVREHDIDVVHEPIPVSPKFPSVMFSVGAPVIIGPMNGGIDYPPGFRTRQNRFVELVVLLGRQVSSFCNRLLPGKLKAHTLLVANERTKLALPTGVRGKVIELVENGVDMSVWRSAASQDKIPNPVAHFIYVGRLVDWKAVDLLLEAFQPVAVATGATLEIVGDGAMRQELEAQSARLGLTDKVAFKGWLSQAECAERLRAADGLILPSLMECGGAAVLEAMVMGLPAIATAWGGPVDYLDAASGILVEPTSRGKMIGGLTEAMLKLARSPELRLKMGRAGQERVRQHFDWERKIDRILEIYQQAIRTYEPGQD